MSRPVKFRRLQLNRTRALQKKEKRIVSSRHSRESAILLSRRISLLATAFFKTSSRREQDRSLMAETKSQIVQHVVIAKFKEDVGPQEIEELVEGYANLVSLIDSIKDFHWGTELSIENLHQGFTHVFVSTFESPAGIPEFVAHQAHIEFADKFAKVVEKFLIVDYKPITLK